MAVGWAPITWSKIMQSNYPVCATPLEKWEVSPYYSAHAVGSALIQAVGQANDPAAAASAYLITMIGI
jgi:hypothetical protein